MSRIKYEYPYLLIYIERDFPMISLTIVPRGCASGRSEKCSGQYHVYEHLDTNVCALNAIETESARKANIENIFIIFVKISFSLQTKQQVAGLAKQKEHFVLL